MSHYLVSEAAQADVQAIWEWVAQDRPLVADMLVDALERAFQHVADYPEVGRAISGDLAAPARRRYSVKRYGISIVFRRVEDTTWILRVLGRGRDLGPVLRGP